ncbi:MAG: YggS family pyridoxal phosphate-dependent enzyme [Pirellulales bacterium]
MKLVQGKQSATHHAEMKDSERRIADNLAAVRARIAAAATASGRSADQITLVAATKYVSATHAAALVAAGCHDLGESRPQELWSKAGALSESAGRVAAQTSDAVRSPVRWHLIGHLQRNKIRRTLPLVHLIQSVDSRRLIEALEAEAALLGRPVSVLVEINVSGDDAKTGLPAAELEALVADAPRWPHVAIRGLMGMASLAGGLDAARRDFERLRTLRDRVARAVPPGVSLAELSMGMSEDFEVAIECGATIIRVGSALFEGCEP